MLGRYNSSICYGHRDSRGKGAGPREVGGSKGGYIAGGSGALANGAPPYTAGSCGRGGGSVTRSVIGV